MRLNGLGQWKMEDHHGYQSQVSTLIQSSANAALVGVFIAFTAQSARADDPAKVLKAMTDYTAAQKACK
jgi:hypothetical protein